MNISTLPKLVKEKIDDYKTINQINMAVDNLFQKIKRELREATNIISTSVDLRICHAYEFVEGRKVYCACIGTSDDDDLVYICDNHHQSSSEALCMTHSKGKIFRVKIRRESRSYNGKYKIISENAIYCKKCIESGEIEGIIETKEIDQPLNSDESNDESDDE